MKQEIISHITTLKETLVNLSEYIYNNPEEGFHEHKACNYIISILEKNNFKVTGNYLNMPTSFYAEYGSGHPKICYLCEYDAIKDKGHITGHNLISSMSIGAALGLSKVIDKIGGSIIVLGCPGEFVGGSKVTMVRQGTFEDIDLVLMAHPDVITAESGTSSAILPLSIKYTGIETLSYLKDTNYSALDACLFTFTGLDQLTKGFSKGITLEGILASAGTTPAMLPNTSEAKFYIRAENMESAEHLESKIRYFADSISYLMDIKNEVSFYELPYDELITNKALSRIFSHNLKENGIIDCDGVKNTKAGLSIGNVSHVSPCIHPYIKVVEDDSVKYSSTEFAKATLGQFAVERMISTAETLAITGLDILLKEELLNEVRNEFYSSVKDKE
jgi:amidohydrolase